MWQDAPPWKTLIGGRRGRPGCQEGGNDFVSGVRGHCLTIAFNRPPFQFCTKLILTAVLYVVALVTYRAPSNAIKAMELLSQMSRLFLEAFTKKGSILFELNQSVI